jgi:hypothetical protein
MKSPITVAALACIFLTLPVLGNAQTHETLLSSTENAYNPIASPDGKYIAFVRTGRWSGGSGGFGRSNLRSEVAFMDANGNVLTGDSPARCFLQEWIPDSDDVVCYRGTRYYLVSPPGTIARQGETTFPPVIPAKMVQGERVAYLSKRDEFVWLHRISGVESELYTPQGPLEGSYVGLSLGDILVASHDERYIAACNDWAGLKVYDTVTKRWTDFGKIIVHPDRDWSWMQPGWNPWFTRKPDDDRLAFIQDGKLIVASADGKKKVVVLNNLKNAGLAVPSPDGTQVAFATFDPTPMKLRPDLQFYGGTTLWVTSISPNSTAKPVTQKSPETTFTLRWLGNAKLLFDRATDDIAFNASHRLWTADVP